LSGSGRGAVAEGTVKRVADERHHQAVERLGLIVAFGKGEVAAQKQREEFIGARERGR
jgi:hypothetical protein